MTVQVWIQRVLNTGWNVLRYDQSTCPPEELPGCQLDLLPRFTQTFTSFFRAGKLLPVPGEMAEQPLLPGPAAGTARHGTTQDSQWAAPGLAGRWHSQDDGKAGVAVPGYGGLVGAAGGIWVVLGVVV